MISTIKSFVQQPERRAVGIVFMVISLLFGAWVTRLPEIKDRLELGEAELGFALFFIPLGATSLVPFYGKIIHYLGERRATTLGAYFFLVAILLPVVAPDYTTFIISLFLVGLGIGLTDVAMNAVAAEVERQYECVIMSACHGFFSAGGMIGAASATIFITLDVSPFVHLLCCAILMLVLVLLTAKELTSGDGKDAEAHSLRLPTKPVILLAVIGFCIMMSEGGITDWSTIYLRDNLRAAENYAGLGFAGFSLTMAVGRFLGDKLIMKYGAKPLIFRGTLIAMLGLLLAIVGDSTLAIIGFSLAGIGYAVIVPILFSAAAKAEGVKPAVGIAAVASSGYIGLLLGPVLIGLVAEEWGLQNGFLMLLLLTLLALILSGRVKS